MKLKINQKGKIEIFRKGEFVIAKCPFTNELMECGDWCVMFSEPTKELLPDGEEVIFLRLCCKTYSVKPEDFLDGRSDYEEL